jgi:hypothetical protein
MRRARHRDFRVQIEDGMTALIRIDRSHAAADMDRQRPIRFCTRCGHPSDLAAGRPVHGARVCDRCGLGMLLTCSRDAMPGEAAAFLIVTFDMRVSAVSQAGEHIFGAEQSVIGTPVLKLIGSPLGDDHLARYVGQAAQRACDPVVMPVRLVERVKSASTLGTLAARIATCGPPRAALITVEPSEFGRR